MKKRPTFIFMIPNTQTMSSYLLKTTNSFTKKLNFRNPTYTKHSNSLNEAKNTTLFIL